ncbi:MAG: glycosyltransferase family 2 protein [Lachnospiraceae bacterium]|jgi:teichuronic acid biosynthesis glycosyltransferase TuaG|nr:glycosyltransferase family 2 protein [Lachnospiraceae bacterium]
MQEVLETRPPVVSIVTPVYNVEKFIEETMDSVRAQTFQDWELLLVEDGSKDHTADVISAYLERTQEHRIRLIRMEQNGGAARARNRGVKEAKGRYLAYIDADDLWEPEKLEHQLALMQEKGAAFSFTGYEFADENGKGLGKIVKVPETIDYKEALKNTTIFTSTVMFDLQQLTKEELEMPQIKSEDTALWWRVLRSGHLAYGLDENLVKYRRAGKSLSSNKLEALRRIWNLYRKAEGMSIPSSAWHFCFWAVRAVKRRI